MKPVLVTGATGFLGMRTCRFLSDRGFRVRAMGRSRERLAQLAEQGCETLEADLRDPEARVRAVEGCSAVIHAGALSSAWGAREDFIAINAEATRELARESRLAGCDAFIFVSSPSVYFTMAHRRNVSESDPLPRRLVNDYAESKALAEQYVLALRGPRSVVLRPQAIFGEGETALLPRLLATAARFGIPELTPGGPVLDLTYVDNVCHALVLALNNPQAQGVFNITNHQPVPLLPFLKDLFGRLRVPWKSVRRSRAALLIAAGLLEGWHRVFLPRVEPPLTRYAVGVLAYDRTLDTTRAQQELGYQPIVSLEEGVSRFVESYRTRA